MAKPIKTVFLLFAFLYLSALLICPADDLSGIKQTLSDKAYGNYWDRLKAINKLKAFNSKEAAMMLVSLFDDDEAPIREAALTTLGCFTDKDALDYLATTALVNMKSSQQRLYAAWALGIIRNEAVLPHLVKALNNEPDEDALSRIIRSIADQPNNSKAEDGHPPLRSRRFEMAEDGLIRKLSDGSSAVRASAIEALGRMGSTESYVHILKRAYTTNPSIRTAALEALARIKPQESIGYLESALKDTLPEARITALEMLTRHCNDKTLVLKSATGLLRDKNPAVRATAVQSLMELREKEGLKALIDCLPEASWRLRYDIVTALKNLTGRDFGFDARAWFNWYEANKDKIEIMTEGPARLDTRSGGKGMPADIDTVKQPDLSGETIPTFFGIPVAGRDVVFIIDFSKSMKNEAQDDDDKKERKADIAIRELEETLKRFPPEMKFNIIILSTEAARYNKRKASKIMLPATEENKKAALDFVRSVWDRLEDLRRGRGDHYDALVEALSEPEVDTVFLLSDGKPTYGTYVQPDNIIENIYRLNRFKKIVINTITTGKKGTNRELMEKLAEDSNGICVSR
ncbi:MAG: HEAT repeat domain-containing protein [Planctomycetota bacterium]